MIRHAAISWPRAALHGLIWHFRRPSLVELECEVRVQDLVRLRGTPERDGAFLEVRRDVVAVGMDVARHHAIDHDVLRRQLGGEALGQAGDASLGGDHMRPAADARMAGHAADEVSTRGEAEVLLSRR